MRTIITFFLFTFIVITSFGQINPNSRHKEEKGVYKNDKGEKIRPADFPGGMVKFYSYIKKKMKYPKDAKRNNIKGKVYVEFVVDKEGKVKQETVTVRNELCPSCDVEAMRLIKGSPAWIPGVNLDTNEKIEFKFVLPINFNR
jgi:TonB family protein